MRILVSTLALVTVLTSGWPSLADDFTGDELRQLLANGLTLKLGGTYEGYEGSVRLEADGTGFGSAVTNDGKKFDITGTWTIEDDRFCRKWKFNNFKKECETWRKVGEKKVDVLVNGTKIGVNSW